MSSKLFIVLLVLAAVWFLSIDGVDRDRRDDDAKASGGRRSILENLVIQGRNKRCSIHSRTPCLRGLLRIVLVDFRPSRNK